MRKKYPLVVSLLLVGILTTACGGGGGGGGGGPVADPRVSQRPPVNDPLADLPLPTLTPLLGSPAAAWLTSEYAASRGLAIMGAAEGYSAQTMGLLGGQGKRVAIIDGGVDFAHSEFQGGDAYILANLGHATDTVDRSAHGTFMAGIVAGRRNNSLGHGVAYKADLASLKVLAVDPTRPGGRSTSSETGASDIARAILSAAGIDADVPMYGADGYRRNTLRTRPEARSDVINLSLGGPPTLQIREAMIRAADAGTIMVSSLGNSRNFGATGAPAIYADDANGHAIAVAALDASGDRLASFSNTCGDVRNCLAAPGERILSAVPDYPNASGLTHSAYGDGTSMAAAHVSGAVAVALAAFPGVPPEDIVSRIFETARDIGNPGWDSVYGYGSLNLQTLLQPIGGLSVTTGASVSGQSIAVNRFASRAGPGGSGAALASQATSVMAVDDRGFPFAYDLSKTGVSGRRAVRDALDDFIAFEPAWYSSTILPELGLAVSFRHEDRDLYGYDRATLREDDDIYGTGQAHVSFNVAPGLILGLSSKSGMSSELSGAHASLVSTGLLGSTVTDADPVPFSGDGDGVSMAYALSDNLWMETGVHMAEGYYGDSDTNTAVFGLRHRRGSVELGARVAYVEEDGAILGTVYDGYTNSLRAETVTGGIDVAWSPNDLVSFTAGYAMAQTQSDSSGLTEFGTQVSDSFSAAAQIRSLLGDNDRLTLIASLPFATQSAKARMRLPVGRTQAGAVRYETQEVDISTERREQALQAIYSIPFANGAQLDLAAYARANADHIRGNEDTGAAIRFFKRF